MIITSAEYVISGRYDREYVYVTHSGVSGKESRIDLEEKIDSIDSLCDNGYSRDSFRKKDRFSIYRERDNNY